MLFETVGHARYAGEMTMRHAFFALALAMTASTAMARAGGVGSGGGKGVLCTTYGVNTVEALDLWEAKDVWGYALPPSQNLDQEMNRVRAREYSSWYETPDQAPFSYGTQSFAMWKTNYQNSFEAFMRKIPAGSHLTPTDDATIILQPPPNCQIVQVLVYLDEGTSTNGILVDAELWNLLDDQNKLAFYFHETTYKMWRDGDPGYRNTDVIRKYVGALFSIDSFPSPVAKVRLADHALDCTTDAPDRNNAHFYVTQITVDPDRPDVPHSKVYFDRLGAFGKFEGGTVEYSGVTDIPYGYFTGGSALGIFATGIQINSIFKGFSLYISAGPRDQCSDEGCGSFVEQKNADGSKTKQAFTCRPFIPVK